MSPKIKCHQNWNVTTNEMSQRLKCHQNWNDTKTEMSLILKCHKKHSFYQNWNFKTENFTKILILRNLKIKPEILLKFNYLQNYWITQSNDKFICQFQIQEIGTDCLDLVLFLFGLKTKEANRATISLQHCSTCIFVLLSGAVQSWPQCQCQCKWLFLLSPCQTFRLLGC